MKHANVVVAASALAALLFSSCKSSESSGRVKPTGALGETGRFLPEDGDKGTLVYVDHAANFRAYDQVYISPIVIRGTSKKGKKDKLTASERRQLANYFETALKRELGRDYGIASLKGPGVLDFRVVLTSASKSAPVLDSATTLYPTAFLGSHLLKPITGGHSFTGRASVEMEVKDGATGQRLIGVMSARTGGKDWSNKFDKWNDVKAAIDHWAVGCRERLAKLRRKSPPPSTTTTSTTRSTRTTPTTPVTPSTPSTITVPTTPTPPSTITVPSTPSTPTTPSTPSTPTAPSRITVPPTPPSTITIPDSP